MHHVPCIAPTCSPPFAAAATSDAAQFILYDAGYVRYIRGGGGKGGGRVVYYVKASLLVVVYLMLGGIEPRLLSRPRLYAYCAHVNGHIDTDVWRSYRERACSAPHRHRHYHHHHHRHHHRHHRRRYPTIATGHLRPALRLSSFFFISMLLFDSYFISFLFIIRHLSLLLHYGSSFTFSRLLRFATRFPFARPVHRNA